MLDKDSKDGFNQFQNEERIAKVAHGLISQLDEENVRRSADFDKSITLMVGHLMDEGVVIKNFVNASRRAVFEIEYKNKRGVVKFSLAKHTYEQTENQQKREETRSHFAKMEGDQEHFALILLSDQNYDWVVQEWAERVNRYEYDDLPEELAETARKYGLNEIEAGYVNGKLKIVDYGY